MAQKFQRISENIFKLQEDPQREMDGDDWEDLAELLESVRDDITNLYRAASMSRMREAGDIVHKTLSEVAQIVNTQTQQIELMAQTRRQDLQNPMNPSE